MNTYTHLLYKGGFLFTDIRNPSFVDDDSEEAFKTWNSIDVSKYKLYYHPSVLVGSAKKEDTMLVILGMVLNPFDEITNSNMIARTLMDYKKKSEIKFINYLNQLSGRFVIISCQGEKIEIFHDACGTRTVFYDKYSSQTIVSSHATMIANLVGHDLSDEAIYFFHNKYYEDAVMKKLPGLTSPFESVFILTPNTKLILPARKIERIFPYKENPTYKNYEDLEEEVAELMVSQIKLLNSKTKIAMSLTSGIDSRVSLAASKDISDEILYFTYVTKNKTHIEDIHTAKKICDDFHLSHQSYQWDKSCLEGVDEFDYIWEKNLGLRRGIAWLNKLYVDSFPKDRIHVRSNIAEVAKADSNSYKYDQLSAPQLASLYSTTRMKEDDKVIKKFEEFMSITDFNEKSMLNYDYRDLFEWEYKMCQWHSWLLLESDMSHDTFLLYNNREILSKMLSIPYNDRLNKKMFVGLIKRLWPELLKYPINKKNYE